MKGFKSGKTIDSLSDKYNCTNTTIIRNLKKSLGDSKYKESLNIIKSLEQKSRKNVNNDFLKIKFDKTKPDGTPRKLLDVSKIRKLGWEYNIKLEDGIKNTYSWFLKNISNIKKIKIDK